MIPNSAPRLIESSVITASSEFGISFKDSAHIMTILRDTLYSDKVLAVLREYSANAWDSHRMSGQPDLPIKVTLPTDMDPTLSIRDFGAGLSHEDALQVYTQYGASTKRSSDTAVGMLGIGSKSGFAYSDSFTITSFHGGMKRTYIAVLDKSEKGLLNMLHEEPSDETGVLFQVAVRPKDIWEFKQKAKSLYEHFVPRPNINIDLPPAPTAKMTLTHGVIYDDYQRSGWVAVMGCVAYRIDLDMLKTGDTQNGAVSFLRDISGALFFNIGEVQISASRESLKDSDLTRAALIAKFDLLVEEYVKHALDTIENGGFQPWEKRIRGQTLGKLGLPIPKIFKVLTESFVSLKDVDHPTFTIMQEKSFSTSISISNYTRIVLRDDERALHGFRFAATDYLIRPVAKTDWDTVEADLNKMFEALGITGVPTVKTSTLGWNTGGRDAKGRKVKVPNKKHTVRTFEFVPLDSHRHYSKPYSSYWDVEERTPTVDDVFVLIEGFVVQPEGFFELYHSDAVFADEAGKKMPTIYAYKTTGKQPVLAKDCLGKEYHVWRKDFLPTLATPTLKALYNSWCWSTLGNSSYYHWRYNRIEAVKVLAEALGIDHPLTDLIRKRAAGVKAMEAKNRKITDEVFDSIRSKYSDFIGKTEREVAMEALYEKYPLLSMPNTDMTDLWGEEHSKKWMQYIKALDAARLTPEWEQYLKTLNPEPKEVP